MAKGFLFIWELWSVKTCSFYFQALTNWNYELLLEILTLSSKISYGRDIVEPAFKPGETALVCTYISLHSITQSQNAFSPNSPAIGEYVLNPLTIWFVMFFPCKIWINELLYLSQGFPEINYNDHLVDYQNFCQRLYIVNETGQMYGSHPMRIGLSCSPWIESCKIWQVTFPFFSSLSRC